MGQKPAMVLGNMWPKEVLHTELELYKLNRTKQRDAVYYQIGRLGPVSRQRLVSELADEMDRRTVYRTIKTFRNALVIRELPGGLVELCPPFKRERYYLVCRGCSRRSPFWENGLEELLNQILAAHRFVLPGQQVELSGLCDQCSQVI
jgi:Fe2+ or Zn2+ uptake regulation protein